MKNRKISVDEMKSLALSSWWIRYLRRAIYEAKEASKDGTLDILLYGQRDYFVPYASSNLRRRNRATSKGRIKGLLRLRGGGLPEGGLPEVDGVLRDAGRLPANEEKTGGNQE
jgi:hypothetical protein